MYISCFLFKSVKSLRRGLFAYINKIDLFTGASVTIKKQQQNNFIINKQRNREEKRDKVRETKRCIYIYIIIQL